MQQEAIFLLDMGPIPVTDDQFFELCAVNPDLRLERTSKGELLIVTSPGGGTRRRNAILVAQVFHWNKQNQSGQVFDSSTSFRLPNSAIRAPDVSWIRSERWEQVTVEQREKFVPLSPDFVIELFAYPEPLPILRAKMQEYLDNGTTLGWLVDPERQVVEVFRKGHEVELLERPEQVSGAPEMPGLLVNMKEIWEE